MTQYRVTDRGGAPKVCRAVEARENRRVYGVGIRSGRSGSDPVDLLRREDGRGEGARGVGAWVCMREPMGLFIRND